MHSQLITINSRYGYKATQARSDFVEFIAVLSLRGQNNTADISCQLSSLLREGTNLHCALVSHSLSVLISRSRFVYKHRDVLTQIMNLTQVVNIHYLG